MFDRTPKSSSSIQFFYLSVATHCVVAFGLFAVRFNPRVNVPALRNTRASLIAPVTPAPMKRTVVRDLPKRFEIRASVKLPAPIQLVSSLQLTPPPALGPSPVPAIAMEMPAFAPPSAAAQNPV